jgi:hypothetical protein
MHRYIHRYITIARHRPVSWASRIQFTPPAILPKIHSDPFLLSMPSSSEWSLSFGLPHQNFVHFSPLFHACHLSWGWVQIMKQLPPFSHHLFPLRCTEQQIIQIKLTEIWSHSSTFIALWEGELCFFLHSILFLYFQSNFHYVHHILRILTRPHVHYGVTALWVSICSYCWYGLYTEVLRHIFQ